MKNFMAHFFRPLTQLFVEKGILFPDIAERIKFYMVKSAISSAPNKPTDSWISVATGLQRRDIKRLRKIPEQGINKANHLARLVNVWATSKEYASSGRIMRLPKSGSAPSFEALAQSIRRDIHPRTMLDALITSKTVQYHAKTDEIELLEKSYQPMAGSQDQLDYLAHNVGDHMMAACENVLSNPAPHFERAAHYNNLSQDDIADLDAEFRKVQSALLEKIGRMAKERQDKEKPDNTLTYRFRAGGYFYHCRDENE